MIIGIGNVGSTSFKSKIIDIDDKNQIKILGEANLDKIKSEGESNFIHSIGEEEAIKEVIKVKGFRQAIKLVIDWYIKNKIIEKIEDIEAMGFKCTLAKKNGANKLTDNVLKEMEKFKFVAPVHNIPYIETIQELKKILGNIPMVGIFEPSFHYSIPEYRKLSGFPWKWHKQLGIKKHGFHGSSHRYLSAMTFKLEGTENIKLLTIHLGGSSSICAIKDGKSINTSMSFSPNSGLLQGTRVGDVDGTALLYAMKELGLSVEEAQNEISENAGLKSIAGIDTDEVKDILEASNEGNIRAKMGVDLFVDGIRNYIGAFSTALGGIDCIAFGGGIGESSIIIREKCLENMEYMGIKLDLVKNKELNGKLGLISSDFSKDSRVKIYIIPTNEEIVVAYFTRKVVEEGRDLAPEEMTFQLV